MDIDFTDIDGICFDDVCGEVSQYKKSPHFVPATKIYSYLVDTTRHVHANGYPVRR